MRQIMRQDSTGLAASWFHLCKSSLFIPILMSVPVVCIEMEKNMNAREGGGHSLNSTRPNPLK